MSVPSSSFTILLLTNDKTAVQALVRQIFKDASVTIARMFRPFIRSCRNIDLTPS